MQRGQSVVLLVDAVAGLVGVSGGSHLDAELAQGVLVAFELAARGDRIGGWAVRSVSRHAGYELFGTQAGGGVAQSEKKAHQALLGTAGLLAHGVLA